VGKFRAQNRAKSIPANIPKISGRSGVDGVKKAKKIEV
jgi:hypothetical protein